MARQVGEAVLDRLRHNELCSRVLEARKGMNKARRETARVASKNSAPGFQGSSAEELELMYQLKLEKVSPRGTACITIV